MLYNHLQKISGNSIWKLAIDVTRLFGFSQRKMSETNGRSEKLVLFSGFRGLFSVKGTDLCK